MKKHRIFAIALAVLLLVQLAPVPAFAAAGDVAINEENFPDANFRSYVSSNFDRNYNGVLSEAERNAVTEISISYKDIASLRGVEFFPALEKLNCTWIEFTELDLSHNPALKRLSIIACQITELDLSHNPELEDLSIASHAQLTELDLSHNPKLTYVHAWSSQLTALNVGNNPALEWLDCNDNQLTELDVSHCPALIMLDCSGNQLTELDLSHNPALMYLAVELNPLTALDVRNNPELRCLFAIFYDNPLSEVDCRGLTLLKRLLLQCEEHYTEEEEDIVYEVYLSDPESPDEALQVGFNRGMHLLFDEALIALEIDLPPAKLDYAEGESFDPADAVVYAVYRQEYFTANELHNEEVRRDVTDQVTWMPSGALSASDTVAVASFTEGDVTVTADQSITVMPLRDIMVTKVWNDSDNAADTRPESVTVQLWTNRALSDEVELTAEDGWTCTWYNLPKQMNDGTAIIYEVREVVPEGYRSEITGSVEEGFTITNTLASMELAVEGYEGVYDGRAHSGTVALTLNGEPLTENVTYEYCALQEDGEWSDWSAAAPQVTDVADSGTFRVKAVHAVYGESEPKIYSLTVTPAALKITTESAERKYNGNPLTAPGTIAGFVTVDGVAETATFTVTGSQTQIGSSQNTYELVWDGTAKAGNYTITETLGQLTVTAQEITIMITGHTDTKPYNGENQSVSGFDASSNSALLDVSKISFTGTDTASGINVGTYEMGLAAEQFGYDDPNLTVTFQVTDGWLKIEQLPVTVTITGHTGETIYNGQEQTVEGFEASADSELFDIQTVTYSGEPARGRDVATYPMNLDESKFSCSDGNFAVIFRVTEDGCLTVTPATLTIITESAKRKFNGNPLTAPGTITGFVTVDGVTETATFTVTGSQTQIGSSQNTYELVWDGTAKAGNYTIVETLGELTVTNHFEDPSNPVPAPTPVPGDLNGDDHFAYIVGYPDGTVQPGQNITRAEVATIFFRLLREEVREENFTKRNAFSDVEDGVWFNNAVSTMAKLGIVNGYPDGTFRPYETITRAEFAAIAARFDEKAGAKPADFSDIAGHWASVEIAKAAANGWINGYPDGSFKPDQKITRAESMALINRVLRRDPAQPEDLLLDMTVWPDNLDTNKWYYLDVQEATNSHEYERQTRITEVWTAIRPDPDWTAYEK